MKLNSPFPKKKNTALIERLREDVEAIAFEYGRRVGQLGNLETRDYLLKRMQEIGLRPFNGKSYQLPYEGYLIPSRKAHQFMNLVGVVPGRDRSLTPILLGAHYDSVIDAPCADDNATSVALSLAIAEKAMESPLERDLIIALYDAEEPPYFQTNQMGSTRFYEDHCKGMSFAGVLVTDLIGHDFSVEDLTGPLPKAIKLFTLGLDKTVFLTGAESDGVLPEIIETIAPKHKGINIFPTLNNYIGNMSDHHAFEKHGHPFLFVSCAQGRYYHHELDRLDTPRWINLEKLASITIFITEIIYELDNMPAGAHPYPGDSVEFEIRMIKKLVGATRLKFALKAFDIDMPQTREDVDELIEGLLGNFV